MDYIGGFGGLGVGGLRGMGLEQGENDGFICPIKLICLENLGMIGWKKDDLKLLDKLYYPGIFVI